MAIAFPQTGGVVGAQGGTGWVVEVEGMPLDEAVVVQVERIVVDDRLVLPDTFSIVFRDPMGDVLGRARLDVGRRVTIKTIPLTGTLPETLVTGEVTSLGAEYDATGRRAVVRGYDKSHRLSSGKRTTTYQNVKYSDIAGRIAVESGLLADVDATSGTFDHVIQANQSDLEFLYGLARQVGFDFRVDGDTLLFKKPVESSTAPGEGDAASSNPVQLVWGTNLLEFRGRVSAVAQVSSVEVRGWDPVAKQAVVGTADAETTSAAIGLAPSDLAGKVGGRTMVVVTHGAATQADADRLAAARAEQIASAAYEATAITVGNPALKAGVAVSIAGVEPALCGRWVISASRHEFADGPYRTYLEFAGRQDRSILGLVTQATSGAGAVERMPGVVTAIVDDNDDPDGRGRVRLTYPWMGDSAVSHWARFAAPGAGADSGFAWVPQVGDEVLVAFEQGDPARPFVLGGLWNGQDAIPWDKGGGLDNGKVTSCAIVSRTGHRVTFVESANESRVEIVSAKEAVTIHLDDDAKALKITTTGDVVVEADGNAKVSAQQNIELTAGGSMKLEASGQMTIKGATVALN